MSKFLILLKCEEKRMQKYGINYASIAAALIWIILIQIMQVESFDRYFPLFLFVDVTTMSFLLIGVSMIFERQENALKTLLVVPISKHHYLLSKICATVFASIMILVVLSAYGVLFKGLSIDILWIFGAVILIAFVFACLGILFTYRSKDFTNLLMWVFVLTFVLTIPTLLQAFGVITADWLRYLQYLNPTKAALIILMNSAISQDPQELLFSLAYMIVLAGVSYYFAAKYFDVFQTKEYGGE